MGLNGRPIMSGPAHQDSFTGNLLSRLLNIDEQSSETPLVSLFRRAQEMEKFFESVSNFFTGADQIPWCDRDIVAVSDLSFSLFKFGYSVASCTRFWACDHRAFNKQAVCIIVVLQWRNLRHFCPLEERVASYLDFWKEISCFMYNYLLN